MNEIALIAKMIDHSILHPTFTEEVLEKQCAIAANFHVASVCVKPYHVSKAVALLKGSDVIVGCVIGFPHGNSTIEVKLFETTMALADGAIEIDMVINIGKALSGDWEYIEKEIKTITRACHEKGAIVKVIFETDFITDERDKIRLCQICTKAGVDFVKTSTGYGFVKLAGGNYNYRGATLEDVKLFRTYSGPNVGVKAAGGIRTLDDLLAMKAAGATRVGATATEEILREAKLRFGE